MPIPHILARSVAARTAARAARAQLPRRDCADACADAASARIGMQMLIYAFIGAGSPLKSGGGVTVHELADGSWRMTNAPDSAADEARGRACADGVKRLGPSVTTSALKAAAKSYERLAGLNVTQALQPCSPSEMRRLELMMRARRRNCSRTEGTTFISPPPVPSSRRAWYPPTPTRR